MRVNKCSRAAWQSKKHHTLARLGPGVLCELLHSDAVCLVVGNDGRAVTVLISDEGVVRVPLAEAEDYWHAMWSQAP